MKIVKYLFNFFNFLFIYYLVTFEEKERRIITHYLPYYMILNQAINFLRPKYALSTHSFTAQYEDTPKKEYEVGLLFRERSPLVDKVNTFTIILIFFRLKKALKQIRLIID